MRVQHEYERGGARAYIASLDVHRADASVRRLTRAHPRLIPVHALVHASWLNQIEIYFSIVQRKALPPNDSPGLKAIAHRLASFERYFESVAHPFE